ncbi:MAG TPA: glycosyltransferase, partial [Clostridia bacterium]
IYAGSDIFLMPSKFEPCGLGQLISLRYGTIPVVRSTGGLVDTIKDYTLDPKKGNGFSFTEFSKDKFYDALMRAIKLYKQSPAKWQELVGRALKLDFSWNASAEKYMDLYKKAIKKGKRKGI